MFHVTAFPFQYSRGGISIHIWYSAADLPPGRTGLQPLLPVEFLWSPPQPPPRNFLEEEGRKEEQEVEEEQESPS
jgi:hypothetical protein